MSRRVERKRMPSAPTVLIGAIVLLFALTRLLWLTRMPVFIDEALHIWRGRLTLQGDWFIGADHGKWLGMKLMALFLLLPLPPLFAARLGVVLISFGTLAGIYQVGRTLFSRSVAVAAIALYTILPYALFYERTALVDPIVAGLAVWSAYFAIRSVQTRRRLWPILLGLALSLAVLVKLSAVLLIVIPLLALLALGDRLPPRDVLRVIGPTALLLALTAAFMALGRFELWQFEDKTVDANSGHLLATVLQNLSMVSGWFWRLYTPPLALLALGASLAALLDPQRRKTIFLLLAALAMVAPYVAAADTLYPRYLVPANPFVVLLMARLIARAAAALAARWGSHPRWQWALNGAVALGLLASVLRLDTQMMSDLPNAHLPESVHEQFVSGWPAGYGVDQAAQFLLKSASKQPDGIYMVRFSYPEQPNQGLDVYLEPSVWIEDNELIAWDDNALHQMESLAAERTTYLVITTEQWLREPGLLTDLTMEKIWSHPRPGTEAGIEIWRVEPGLREVDAPPDAGTL